MTLSDVGGELREQSFEILGTGKTALLVHVPHASMFFPEEAEYLISGAELQQECQRLVDHYTDVVFDAVVSAGGRMFKNRLCRLFFDPERFLEPEKELMNEFGMGIFYTHGTFGNRIRLDDSAEQWKEKVERYYLPYHHALREECRRLHDRFGHCFVIDAHSYPQTCYPFERHHHMERPQICLGTSKEHTPKWLKQILAELFLDAGYSVAWDQPFAGTLIPSGIERPNVYGFMVEIRRDVYMSYDASGTAIPVEEKLQKIQSLIFALCARLKTV